MKRSELRESGGTVPQRSDPFSDEWVRLPPSARGLRRDVVTGAVLVVATAFSVSLYQSIGMFGSTAPLWMCIVWVIAMAGPLTVRRRFPEAVAIVTALAFFLGQLLRVPEGTFSNIALFMAIYTLGAWGRRRFLSVVLRMVIILGMFVWLLVGIVTAPSESLGIDPATVGAGAFVPPAVASALLAIILNLLYFFGAYYFGEVARQSAHRREAVEARTIELAAERSRAAVQAVTLERLRIARELHDVVAHHVSVMGVQAGAARRVLARDPEKATEALGAIERNARSAVEELHLLLTALRSEEPTGPVDVVGGAAADGAPADTGAGTARTDARALAPSAPGLPRASAAPSTPSRSPAGAGAPASAGASTHTLDRLDELVDELVSSGLPVRLTVVGERRPVPATIDLTAYRVTQEALTNVRKHAGPAATADVRVRYLENEIEVEVSDTGSGATAAATAGAASARSAAGLGQIGMRERVAAVGGSIELQTKQRGGYLVRARLPAFDVCATAPDASAPPDARATVEPRQNGRDDAAREAGATRSSPARHPIDTITTGRATTQDDDRGTE